MAKPAPYPPRTPEEISAINTLKALIDPRLVILDIEALRNIPNIDGYADIVDEDLNPIGKLELQVKKLPDNCGANPRLQIPFTLFHYAVSSTLNPVLLIGVDVKEKRAYWLLVTDLVIDQKKLDTQQTITVSFSASRVIDGQDTRYPMEWLQIVQRFRAKLMGFDELKVAYATLSKLVNPAQGIAEPSFRAIHEFLDEMNTLLDGPFSLVKRRFYPNSWKVGLAFSYYDISSVGYTLYPIRSDENDVQIKEISKDLAKEFLRLHGFREYFKENPIQRRPKQHALEMIQEYMNRIIEGRLLDHKGSVALAREFLFAFVDRFSEEIGMKKKDCYSISEIQNAFYRHLPIWADEAVKLLVRKKRNQIRSPADCFYRKPYLDPDLLRCQIMSQEMREIEELVLRRIASSSPIPRIPIGSEELPLGLFVEYDSFLNVNGITEIHRLYEPPDYSRMGRGGYLWDAYSQTSFGKKLKIIYGNFPEVYSSIVEQNFPQIIDRLAPFHRATNVIVVFDAKDRYVSQEEKHIPGIALYYLKHETELELNTIVYHTSECKELVDKLRDSLGKTVEVDGKQFKLIGSSSSIPKIIIETLPMHTLLYEELKRAMSRYFSMTHGEDLRLTNAN